MTEDEAVFGKEPPKWNPPGITPLNAPKEPPADDHRWRPHRGPPEVPADQEERSWKAITDQCLNARMPGYKGFIPSAKAEDVYGRTQATTGRVAVGEQKRTSEWRQTMTMRGAGMKSGGVDRTRSATPGSQGSRRPSDNLSQGSRRPSDNLSQGLVPALPDDHPLGRSRADMGHGHWVPTIPGYGGYIPAKHAENICGGGIMHTCKMAGRSIAERNPLNERPPSASLQDETRKNRFREEYQTWNNSDGSVPRHEQVQLAADVREHCSKQIPGYAGHVPRKHGESIHGTNFAAANRIAADFVDHRIFRPDEHNRLCCNPQVPAPRKVRL